MGGDLGIPGRWGLVGGVWGGTGGVESYLPLAVGGGADSVGGGQTPRNKRWLRAVEVKDMGLGVPIPPPPPYSLRSPSQGASLQRASVSPSVQWVRPTPGG